MKTEFKKWACGLADSAFKPELLGNKDYSVNTIAILIKAMWAINRNNKFFMIMDGYQILVDTGEHNEHFNFAEHDNSEQAALMAALNHIYQETK